MANFSATSSGDFSSYLAGKVLNAANMAKGEKNRREEAGLEQAQPGSLFGKALQSEFGGDLYSRTFGIFDPRKSHGETDRNSSKEARFTAQFPEAKEKDSDGGGRPSGSSQEVEQAKQDLLRDDEKSVPVQDKNLREQFSKIFGSIDVKLIVAEAKIEKSSSKLSVLHQDVLNTQKLILDQNAVLETKFDQILEIFGKQIQFQKELAEDAKVKAKENELEEGQDLSKTRGLIATGTAGGDLSTTLLGFLGRRLGKAISKQVRRRLGSKVAQKGAQKGVQKVATSAAENAAGKALSKSNLAARALRSPAVRKALVRKLGAAGAKKLTAKVAAKLIPGISTAYGLGEGLTRIALGDVKGGFLSFGSAIPIAGYGFAAVDIFRDIDVDAYTKHIEPNLPAPSDDNVGAFFAEALGVMPNQYESGTTGSRRGLASPGPAMLHGKEAILTPEDRRRITQFSVDSINAAGSKMVSTAVAFGDSSGNGSTVRSIFNKLGIDYPLERVAFRFDIGKKSSGGSPISRMFSEAAAAVAGMVGMNNEESSGTDRRTSSGGEYTGLTGMASEYYEYLRSKGLSPNHAMGIVINAERESGFNHADQHTDTNGLQVGGILQWNGGRFDAMVRAVPDWKTNWKAQLDYIWNEPSNLSGYTIDQYKSKTFGSALDAANDWMREWERPQNPSRDAEKHARIYERYTASGLKQLQSGEYNFYGNFSPPTGDARITMDGAQGIDASGEPGVDFSAADWKNNYAVFPGKVVNSRHTRGYGWDVIIRSDDPNNPGKKFDALYAHFPNRESIKVKSGDQVRAGQHLGPVGWIVDPAEPDNPYKGKPAPEAGSMTGPHTSLDFYPVGGPYHKDNPYPAWRQLANGIVSAAGRGVSSNPPSGDPRSAAANLNKQEQAKLEAQRKRQSGGAGSPGYGKGGIGGSSPGSKMLSNDVGGTGGPGNSSFRNSNERRVYNALKSKSFTDAQISAIMANFDIETMGYTRMRQLENGPGRGLAQWETPGRWDQALEWYASKGKNPKNLINDIEGQIDWMVYEFTKIPTDSQGRPMLPNGFRYDLTRWKNSSKDPIELARNFMNWYEAPGTPHIAHRLSSAGRYFRMLPRKVKKNKPKPPAGPKTIIESLRDDSGFSGFIPPALRNMIPRELQKRSSLMEDMEDAGGTRVQYVIINNAVAVNKPSSVNSSGSSSTTRSTSLSELHLASLGA